MPRLPISCALLLVWALAPGASAQGPEAAPDLELLEFLGEWETDDGELLDPLSLDQDAGSERFPAEPSPGVGERGWREPSPVPGRTGSPHSGVSHEDDVDATIAD